MPKRANDLAGRARTPVLTIWLVLFASTFILCKITQPPEWPAYPSTFARWVSLPITLTGLSDLRYYALPLGTAICLIFLAVIGVPRRDAAASGFWRTHWFESGAIACFALACISATVNKTWDVSIGWIFELAASYAWVALLSRLLDLGTMNKAMLGCGVIAIGGVVASIGHRQILGERFFDLPIGPVTLTAALGSFWAVSSIAWLASMLVNRDKPSRRLVFSALLSLLVGVSGLMLLTFADRRGAWLGLIAGVGYVCVLLVWSRHSGRVSRSAIIAASAGLLGVTVAACAYLAARAMAIVAPGSSFDYRLVYWRKIYQVLPDQWLFGSGPDTFLFKMTSMMARQRADMPRVFQGNIDVDAHNEWLQGIFELGLPAGLLYLAIPALVLFFVTRAFLQAPDPSRKAVLLAIGAGLVSIMATESSSVNMRQPMLSAWFYTLLGFGLVAIKPGDHAKVVGASKPSANPVSRAALVIASLCVLAIIVVDVRSGMAHAQGKALMESNPPEAERLLSRSTRRMRSMRWLATHYELSLARMAQLRATHPAGTPAPAAVGADGRPTEFGNLVERTLAGWREITSRCTEYSGASFGIAEALMLAGRTEEACQQLDSNLKDINPYDKRSNALLAAICPISTIEQLQCIRRALRETPWDGVMQRRSAMSFAEPNVLAQWQPLVASARVDVTKNRTAEWTDPLSPETLRIEAGRLVAEGNIVEAAQVQLDAANAYEKLRLESSPYRRPAAVEADAQHRAAQFVFYADPSRVAQAAELVGKAEGFAALGIICDPVPDAKPTDEYVGGQVIPVERPDWCLPIWRFAAMMRLATMRTPDSITQRVEWSLPPRHRTSEALASELGRMAGELVDIFAALPESQRPPSFAWLVERKQMFQSRQPQK
jgi:O-antigen ligase